MLFFQDASDSPWQPELPPSTKIRRAVLVVMEDVAQGKVIRWGRGTWSSKGTSDAEFDSYAIRRVMGRSKPSYRLPLSGKRGTGDEKQRQWI